MLIDSHCHLDCEPMGSNLQEVVDRAVKNNVKYLLSISTTDKSYDRILDIIKNHKNIYGTTEFTRMKQKIIKYFHQIKLLQKLL